jgi:hypothetical protein
MILHEKRLIFVHIQKTGGDSVSIALGQHPNCPGKHFSATELRDLYGAATWDSYFKFSFVRNPWDRLVSWWANVDSKRPAFERGDRLNQFQTYVLGRAQTFDEFLANCGDEIDDIDGKKWIYRNQIDYLSDSGGSILVDFVGKFESLRDEFAKAMEKSGAEPVDLPHVNQSERRPYRDYYNAQTQALVLSRFQRDIEAFGYTF